MSLAPRGGGGEDKHSFQRHEIITELTNTLSLSLLLSMCVSHSVSGVITMAGNSNSLITWQQQKLLAWQLAHPSGTAEECIDWMKQTHSKRVKTG